MTGIIEKSSGLNCLDFANRYLFKPLDIPEHIPHGDSSKEDQLNYLMSKAPRKNEWYSDPQGRVTAGWGLALSACDLAKIGTLVLNSGLYHQIRVVSEQWIAQMTAPRLQLDERFGNMEYGYLWYRPYKNKPVVAAIGDGGNIIYVNPDNQVSVGVTGTFKVRIYDRVEFIETHVLPVIMGE